MDPWKVEIAKLGIYWASLEADQKKIQWQKEMKREHVWLDSGTHVESYDDTAGTTELWGMDRPVNKWYCDNRLDKQNKIVPYLITAATKINSG